MNKIVQLNSGRATHFKHEVAGIVCGSTSNGKKRIERATGLEATKENITCKKCLAAYDKLVKEQVQEPAEMSLKEYKEKGISWIIKK